MSVRRVLVVVHRYVGLAIALFLVVAGLTGSILAYQHELDVVLNPSLFHAEAPSPGAEPLTFLHMRQRLLEQLPGADVSYVPLRFTPNQSVLFYASAGEAGPELDNDQYFVDPYTGNLLGGRRWSDISQGPKNLIPFIYKLHYSLALGSVGKFLLGVVALLWTIDCFVGAWLTFPPRPKSTTNKRSSKGWWRLWFKSWLFKTGGLYKATFTWHRAGGLWLWGMLLVFAWSSVGMNLAEVYEPIMKPLFGLDEHPYFTIPKLDQPRHTSEISWPEAIQRGREIMAAQADARGFEVQQPQYLRYSASQGVYRYQVRSSLDITKRYPSTVIWFDSNTGEQVAFLAPTGQTAGNTITTWLDNLHFAAVGGWPYQAFVCLLGLAVTALSVSGVIIWHKKWKARRSQRKNNRSAQVK
ncbi:MAG: PepSY-associated TM helix domain-containing protein [Pirellulaceae bacterium]